MSELPEDRFAGRSPDPGPTRWTLILQAVSGDAEVAAAALEALVRQYWFPLYAYARQRGLGPEDAEDAVQEFFLVSWLGRELLEKADRSRGKFRNFLLTVWQQSLTDIYRKGHSQKRGGGKVERLPEDADAFYGLLDAGGLSPEEAYEKAAAWHWVDVAMASLMAESENQRVLLEFLNAGSPAGEREAVAAGLGLAPVAFNQRVHRMRKFLLPQRIRAEIREVCAGPTEAEEEWALVCHYLPWLAT